MQKLEAAGAEADVDVDVCGVKTKLRFVRMLHGQRWEVGNIFNMADARNQGGKNLPSVW